MKKQLPLFILTLLFYSFANAQGFDVRKLTLKSDVILLYDQDSIANTNEIINDYTSVNYYQLKAITWEIKNTVNFKFTNTKLRNLVENEDYFKIYEKGDCLGIGYATPIGPKPKYFGMLFLQRRDKQFHVIGVVENRNPLPNWEDLIKQIKSVTSLEKIKNLQERYTKSIDWFLDNNVMPDEGFIKYYRQTGILKTDTAQLNEQQLASARALFFNGNETFLDLIASTNPTEIKAFYLQKLRDIVFQSEYEFGDCLRFSRIATMLTDEFNNNYDDLNRTLTDLLTKDELENYEKRPIMKHLIDLIEKETYKVGKFSSSKL